MLVLIRENGVNIHQKRTNFKRKLNKSFASTANVKVCILKFLAKLIYQVTEIWVVRLYQKMIEIYCEKIKLGKLAYIKEIQRVEVSLNKK